MQQAGRPLSPHLQVYRWYFTMALSIAHRASGLALTGGLFLLVLWLVCLATGPQAYAGFEWWMTSILGRLVMVALTFVLMFHAANGVRHLFWDMGYGFALETARRSGQAAIATAAVLTVLIWLAYLVLA